MNGNEILVKDGWHSDYGIRVWKTEPLTILY